MNIIKEKIKKNLNDWAFWTLVARLFVWLSFFIAGLYFLHVVLFPSRTFEYFFDTPSALKNTVADPRIDEQSVNKGLLDKNSPLVFNTNLVGSYSHVLISLELNKKSSIPEEFLSSIRRSYRAFLFPEEGVANFADGSLITDGESFFMISQGKIRQFSSIEQLKTRALDPKSFLFVNKDSLSVLDSDIAIETNEFPDGSFLKIDSIYYQIRDGVLFKFLSDTAFKTNANETWAQLADPDLLNKYVLSEIPIGFRDGTLVSSNESVFILSGGKRYPIDNVETFTAMGYSWDDLIAITPEELGAYEKQKLFTQDSPHPDGTVFVDKISGDYFMVSKDKKKRFISSLAAQSYLRGSSAITVDANSIEVAADCKMNESFSLFSKNFICQVPLIKLAELPGNDFEFSLISNVDNVKAKYLNITFKKVIGNENMFSSLAQIKGNIKKNYYGSQPQ